MIYNYSRHLISVSDFASKSLLIRSGFNDKKKIGFIYNGYSLKKI